MRYPPLLTSVSFGKFWRTTLLAFFLQTMLLIAATFPDELSSSLDDNNLQVEEEMQKRDWNRNLNVWGKRAWRDLHGGWGLKRSASPSLDQNIYPAVHKKNWQSFQGGWGKRQADEYQDVSPYQTTSTLEQEDLQNLFMEPDNAIDEHIEEKRKNWVKFTDGWGKRNNWEGFRGAWGKREPAWVNLKGVWGKRSESKSYIN